jgi:uncharacterized protein YjdB
MSGTPAVINGGTALITYMFQDGAGCNATAFTSVTINAAPQANLSNILVLCGEIGTIAVQPVAPDQT